jgi:hypothetical protein
MWLPLIMKSGVTAGWSGRSQIKPDRTRLSGDFACGRKTQAH